MKWTHKVVKSQRGMDGKFFDHPGTGYRSFGEALDAAREFANDQHRHGVSGTRISVISRKKPAELYTFTLDGDEMREADWR